MAAKIDQVILIGIGANLALRSNHSPLFTCQKALRVIEDSGIAILSKSSWYLSEPVPISVEPWYTNGVISVSTDLQENELLGRLMSIETLFGRSARKRLGPRTLDLDLLAYGEIVCDEKGWPRLSLPHPRLQKRNFVIVPLAEILPSWRHPVSGEMACDLARNLHSNQKIVKLDPQALEI
mgnify:CR=1 FL=1|tara:strand:- start:30 stop:569 length:540 start_codon:yes stop_codon:yes gene_type:complete